MSDITIIIKNCEVIVDKEEYIQAKTKDLQEFGYTNLKESEVRKQLESVLEGGSLSVIGQFIKDDIVCSELYKKSIENIREKKDEYKV